MADIVERLVVLSKAVSAKVWNGITVVGNPCAIVDVQKTVSKRGAASERELTSALAFDDDEKEADAALEELVPLVGARKPPRPLKNGKVFTEAGDRERRNLLELMARIDGVAGQKFGISRARTVRGTNDLIEKDAVLILRRNQTVRVVESEALSKSERISRLDAKIKHKTGEEQEKAGRIQDKAEEIQKKAEKIQKKAEKIQEKEGKIQEKVGDILHKPEKIQEKEGKIQESVGEILHKEEKIQEMARQNNDKIEKIQENEGKIHENEGKIQDTQANIQEQCPTHSGEDSRKGRENSMEDGRKLKLSSVLEASLIN